MDASEWIILIGVPVLTTVATLSANILLNIRNHRSNIVSKSRVEWINRVRELSAEYITARDNSYSKRIMYLKNYKNEKIRNKTEKLYYESLEQQDEAQRLYNLLKLYFAVNTDNAKVHDNLRSMKRMLQADLKEMNLVKKNEDEDEIRNLVKKMEIRRDRINISFSREMNRYLNKEWHRTKRNEK